MNIYQGARSRWLTGSLNCISDPLSLVLVNPSFTFDDTDSFLNAITGVIGTPEPVTVTSVDFGMVQADPVTFTAVPATATVAGLVLFQDSGDPITSLLIAHIDRRADAVPLNPLTGDDGNLIFTFPDYLLKI